MSTGKTVAAAVADLLVVVVFVIIGRSSHAEGITAAGVATTLWPFLVGTVLGWVLARVWRAPRALGRAGVPVWLATLVVGMVLRVLVGQGTEPSFIIVAGCFLALFFLGWRAVAALALRMTARRNPQPRG